MILDGIMTFVGVLIALIMASGLAICWILSLAVLDYVFDTDLKGWLVKHVPSWSIFYKLRKFVATKMDKLDQTIIEQDIRNEQREVKPTKFQEFVDIQEHIVDHYH